MRVFVIDTNWLLDLWVFDDPQARPLRLALEAQQADWVATEAMRAEFERVLTYPAVQRWHRHHGGSPTDALAAFGRHHRRVATAPGCGLRCRDPDDQGFIDLAVAHRAMLLSKDRAVLALRAPLHRLGVTVHAQAPAIWIPPALPR